MGKGSTPRPYSVPLKDYNDKWTAIFGKKDPKESKPEPKQPTDENTAK
jgi:hypothetical protein